MQLSSWEWAQSCSKHVMESNKHIIEEIVSQVGHLPELYEDARSEKYNTLIFTVTYLHLKWHCILYIWYNVIFYLSHTYMLGAELVFTSYTFSFAISIVCPCMYFLLSVACRIICFMLAGDLRSCGMFNNKMSVLLKGRDGVNHGLYIYRNCRPRAI
jgi:hypothetical protein